MTKLWKNVLVLWAIGMGIAMSAPVSAQTVAPGPYYATPSWDQQLPASTRFIVLSNWNSAAVLDRETGLVWERSPSTNGFKWWVDMNNSNDVSAHAHCNSANVGYRFGWRVPTVQELLSLVDGNPANTSNPRLPPGHPFINVSTTSTYLSANRAKEDDTLVWVASFHPVQSIDGFRFNGWTDRTFDLLVWCVRGGSDVNPQ
jgi:hypothetical protein